MLTIGVAIPIPEPWAVQLQDYRTSIGDHTAQQIPTHITLVPPVEVADADLDALERHLTGAADATGPFRIHLRGTGTFRPVSPVVFVSVVEGISNCEQLANVVRRGPLEVDLNFPTTPTSPSPTTSTRVRSTGRSPSSRPSSASSASTPSPSTSTSLTTAGVLRAPSS